MAISSNCADNLVLIGFMGAGKSTVGRELARRSGRYFLDADTLIEASEGRSVAEIFEKRGEAYFRELERETARWLAACVRGSVVSTGGGMPVAVEAPQRLGILIYLKLPFEEAMRRLGPRERAGRPLFHDPERARALFSEREKRYEEVAAITVRADREVDEVVGEILTSLQAPPVSSNPHG